MLADVVIDLLDAMTLGIVFTVWADADIIVVTVVEITSDFIVKFVHAAEALAGVCADTRIEGTCGVGAGVNSSGLTAVVTCLKFTSPALVEKSVFCFLAMCSCSLITAWGSDRALQASKPSCHA